jgi:hypothetical protein
MALAREASASGDRVAAENLYRARGALFSDYECYQRRPTAPCDAPADVETEMAKEEGSEMAGSMRASPSDRQPYWYAWHRLSS